MKAIRFALAGLVIASAAALAWLFVWRPLACHRLAGEIVGPSYEAYDTRGPVERAVAQAHLERIQACLAFGCRDTRMMFIEAINYRTLGRNEIALRIYRESLLLDQRPETFANIADTQLALGDRKGAYENFLRAALFFPAYMMLIDDPLLRQQVRDEVIRRQPGQRWMIERIESGRFFRKWGN
jgi:tetratricopeptide (TPR) repeat protein